MAQKDRLSQTSFWIFSILSFLLSLNMYFQLGWTILEQIFFSSATVGLEFWKISAILKANYFNKINEKWKAFRKYLLYVILALMSIFAGYGYSLTATEHKKASTETAKTSTETEYNSIQDDINRYTKSIDSKEKNIASNNTTILNNTNQINSLPQEGYNNTKISLKNQNDLLIRENAQLRREITDLETKIENKKNDQKVLNLSLSKEEQVETKARNMYDIIADATPLKETGDDVRYFTLIILSILIELGVYSNADSLHYGEEEQKKKKKPIESKKKFSFKFPKIKLPSFKKKAAVIAAPYSIEQEADIELEPEFEEPNQELIDLFKEEPKVEEPKIKEPIIEVKPVEVQPAIEQVVQAFESIPVEKPKVVKSDSSKLEFKIKKDKNLLKKFVNFLFQFYEESGGVFFIDKKELSAKTGLSMDKINYYYDELKELRAINYTEEADAWAPILEKNVILKLIEENY